MSNQVLLSIIIPVYNRHRSLEKLLSDLSRSMISGCYQNMIELIVVDDGSMPLIKIPDSEITISLYRLAKNSGAPKAREMGFQKSNGKFIHFHDSDDSFDKGWLSALVNELEASPELDILLTGRKDISQTGIFYRYQKFFHRNTDKPDRIKQRLIYRNCMGPLGGVTFSRQVLMQVTFKSLASCQDWQMYLDAIKYAKTLKSRSDIIYQFHVSGNDRISHNPAKKLIGHLQLSRLTANDSIFSNNIRLFYLMTCRQHILNKKGIIHRFYKKKRIKFWFNFLLISIYWRLH